MLVLGRKESQSILIGHDIEVTIVRISEGAVRIGVQAPKSTNIVRKELLKTGHRIQTGLDDVADIGCRTIDPLGVAECYEEITE